MKNYMHKTNHVADIKEAVKYARLMGYVLKEQSILGTNDDLDIAFKDYKSWAFNLDGYDVNIFFNCVDANYHPDDFFTIETLEIWSDDLYFIPFKIAFKIALAFFGDKNFILTQIITPTKMIYCWNKMFDSDGESMKPDKKTCFEREHAGIKYHLVKQIPSFF